MIAPPFIHTALLLGALASSCGDSSPAPPLAQHPVELDSTAIPYNLEQPDAAFALPAELLEISGLTAIDSTRLAAVQDERGFIYVLDRETAMIVNGGRFKGRGDYEGIEIAGGRFWILRSDGALFSTSQTIDREMESTRHDLDLHGSCDAEGLAFEARTIRLLIACKEHPGRGLGGSRAIYAYDLATGRRVEAPVYLIEREGLDVPSNLFKPSALAVHPQSGYLYIISSVRKVLIVIDPDQPRQIREARALSTDLFPQPEGLAFFPDGTLFIANEGVNGPATLLRFDQQFPSQ